MKRLVTTALAVAALTFMSSDAMAGYNRFCSDETITYPEVVTGNLIVVKPPVGLGVCRLLGVEVKGNVLVRDDGIVVMNQCLANDGDPACPNPGPRVTTKVYGNVISDGAPRTIRLFGGTQVFGNVMVKNTHGAAVSLICASDIHGHLQVKENQAGVGIGGFGTAPPTGGCGTSGPTVAKHVLVSDNTADVDISVTTVIGHLHCVNNVPPPTDFGGNTVLGKASGQCLGFAQPPSP
jgi:hypothetical protein